MELTEEQREYLRPAMEVYELYLEHQIWTTGAHTGCVTEVRKAIGMSTKDHFSSCPDCIVNYYKEIYKLWKK